MNLQYLEEEFKQAEVYKIFNKKQKEFFTEFFKGNNIFLTGAAGTGKSRCIEELFSFLNSKNIFIGKTALTGVAALNIGGNTIHSWCGIGLADQHLEAVVEKASKNKKARERIRNTGILFIDEISMASADLLEKIEATVKYIKRSSLPWGGMQLILAGDFLQLPPISRNYHSKNLFCFQSKVWTNTNLKIVHLEKLVRQDESTPFAKLLQKIRFGYNKDLDLLSSRVNAELEGDIAPIRIFCKNIDIDKYNLEQYSKIEAEERVYFARDTGNDKYGEFFDRNCLAPRILKLKVGAIVMLLANMDVQNGFVNGSVGVVRAFSVLGPIVKFNNGKENVIDVNKWEAKEQELGLDGKMRYHVVATRSQIPLRLAWSASVHKTMGQTIDKAVMDLSESFEYSQVYVALSRVKTLEGLSLKDFSPSKIKVHPECLAFYKNLKK